MGNEDTKINDELSNNPLTDIDPNGKVQQIGDKIKDILVKTIFDIFFVLSTGVVILLFYNYTDLGEVDKPPSTPTVQTYTLEPCYESKQGNGPNREFAVKSITDTQKFHSTMDDFLDYYCRKSETPINDDESLIGPIGYVIRALHLNCFNYTNQILYKLSKWTQTGTEGMPYICMLLIYIIFFILGQVLNNGLVGMLTPFFPNMAASLLVNIFFSIITSISLIFSVALLCNTTYYLYLLIIGILKTQAGETSFKIKLWYFILLMMTGGSALTMGSTMSNTSSSSSSCNNKSNARAGSGLSILFIIPIWASFYPIYLFIKRAIFGDGNKSDKDPQINLFIIGYGTIMLISIFIYRIVAFGWSYWLPNAPPIA